MKNHVKVLSVLLAIILVVSVMPAAAVSAGAEETDFDTIAVGEYKNLMYIDTLGSVSYRFTPESSGWYRYFTSEAVEANIDDVYVTLYDSYWEELKDDAEYVYYSESDFSEAYYFEAGETYHFVVVAYGSFSKAFYFSLADDLVPATGITINQGESGSAYENTSFTLSAELEPHNAIPEDLTWSSSNEAVATVDQAGKVSCIASGESNITVTTENALSADYHLTVKKIDHQLFEGVEQTVRSDQNRQKDAFFFIPEESGEYKLFFDMNNVFVSASLYNADMRFLQTVYDDLNGSSAMTLEAGETYYFVLDATPYYGYEENSFSYNVMIDRLVEATAISILQGERLTGYVNKQYWFNCTFEPEHAIEEDYSWSSSDPNIVTITPSGYAQFVSAGNATVTASTESGLSASCEVTVKDMPVLSINEEQTGEFTDDCRELYYSFTPEESGYYRFSVSSEDVYTDTDLYDGEYGDWITWDYGYNNSIRIKLDAGKTYHLQTDPYYSDEYGTISVMVEKLAEVTGLSIQQGESYIAYENTNAYFSCDSEPENSYSEITWSSSNESVATIDQTGYASFITPGKTIVTATAENGISASCEVTVKELPTLSLNEEQIGVFTEDRRMLYYSFTPEESGYYRFSVSSDSIYTYMGLKDGESGSWITWDYGYLRGKLDAGKRYLLQIEPDYGDSSGPVTIRVEPCKGAVGMEIVTPPDRTEYISDLVYDELDLSGLSARILWDDGTDTVWNYNDSSREIEDSYVDVDIDRESSSLIISYEGLTASCHLTLTDNPVDHIEINSVPKDEFLYGDLSYCYYSADSYDSETPSYRWSYYYSSRRYQIGYEDAVPEGLSFTVYYKDGTSKRFHWNDTVDGTFDGHSFTFGSYGTQVVMGENTLTLDYMNHSADYAVTVKASGIERIELLKDPDNAAYIYDYGVPDWKGLSFRIHCSDGTKKEYTLDDENWSPSEGSDSFFTVDGIDGRITKTSGGYCLNYLDAKCDLNMIELTSEDQAVENVKIEDFSYDTGRIQLSVTYADHTTEKITVNDPLYVERMGPQAYLRFARYSHGLFYYAVRILSETQYEVRVFNVSQRINKDVTLGDVDGDGNVTSADATFIQRKVTGIDVPFDFADAVADADGDGQLTLMDATYIQRWLASLSSNDNIGKPIT